MKLAEEIINLLEEDSSLHDFIIKQGFTDKLSADAAYEVGDWGSRGKLYMKISDDSVAYINVYNGKIKGLFDDGAGEEYKKVAIANNDDIVKLGRRVK